MFSASRRSARVRRTVIFVTGNTDGLSIRDKVLPLLCLTSVGTSPTITDMQHGREQLKHWIERRELQQQEAASLIGISSSFLSHILNGHRLPTLPIAVLIEETAGIRCASWVPKRDGKPSNGVRWNAKTPMLANR